MTLKRSIQPPSDAPFSIALGPARFFLDDVRDIHDALSEFARKYAGGAGPDVHPGNIEIRALTATAEDFEDLKEATRDELKHISLILSAPKVRVDLWSHNAEFIAESENPITASFALSIKSFVATRHSWRPPMQGSWIGPLLLFWLIVSAFYWFPYTPTSWGLDDTQGINRYDIWFSVFITIAAFVATILSYMLHTSSINVIPLWRKEQRGLSAEARSAIIVGVVCAIVAGILSFWAGIFVHN